MQLLPLADVVPICRKVFSVSSPQGTSDSDGRHSNDDRRSERRGGEDEDAESVQRREGPRVAVELLEDVQHEEMMILLRPSAGAYIKGRSPFDWHGDIGTGSVKVNFQRLFFTIKYCADV